ncbi:hypothetical protein [Mesorhizobium sp. M0715]|uniref:hypothetical protein n=1 Tax=Mesorhizobium sp. M0715 TaxID=2956990 RepID=UPI00333B57A8
MAVETTSVKFHYIKSPLARDLHIDGVYGGINNVTGQLIVSIFAERAPIPTSLTVELSDGTLGKELEREGKDGVVRVVQDTLYMDFATAFVVHKWLGSHIDGFLEAHPELEGKL